MSELFEYLKPLTITTGNGTTVWYSADDGGSMIGGNTCHLCGAKKVREWSDSWSNKHGQWKTRTCITYDCGTVVVSKPSGKKKVVVGVDCIDTGGAA